MRETAEDGTVRREMGTDDSDDSNGSDGTFVETGPT